MIIAYYLIVIFFILYAQKDFKKSFLIFAAASILFNAGMALKFSPPSISCSLVLCIYYTITFFVRSRRVEHKSFYFLPSFILIFFSYILSIIFSIENVGFSGLSVSISHLLEIYIFLFLFWNICQSKKDISFFIKVLFLVFTIVYIYGIFEYLSKSNPFLDIITNSMPEEFAQDKLYVSDLTAMRDGRVRCQSLFYITILYGVYSVLFFSFLLFIVKYKKYFRISSFTLLSLLIMSLVGCYLSNSKTPLVFFPILIIPFIVRNKILLFVDVICIVIVIVSPEILYSFLSLFIDIKAFDVSNDDMSQGSNAYMRFMQLDASVEYFLKAPLLGNGIRSSSVFADKDVRLLGCESVWFRLMIEQGIVGLFAYIYMIITCIKFSLRSNNKMYLCCFTIGFFVICSITDLNYTLFFMLLILMFKISKMYVLNK